MKIQNLEITEKTIIKDFRVNKFRLRKCSTGHITRKRLKISRPDLIEMIKEGQIEIVVYNDGVIAYTRESITNIEQSYIRILKAQRKYLNSLSKK